MVISSIRSAAGIAATCSIRSKTGSWIFRRRCRATPAICCTKWGRGERSRVAAAKGPQDATGRSAGRAGGEGASVLSLGRLGTAGARDGCSADCREGEED